ncbi:M56 and MltD domain-containing protein [Myxococcota bacterium]|nr:M56 and MltD domain-containing protein [Myxococcota bacterium]
MIGALLLLQLSLAVGALLSLGVARVGLPGRAQARLHRLLLVGALLAPFLVGGWSPTPPWRPPAQVFDGVSRGAPQTRVALPGGVQVDVPALPALPTPAGLVLVAALAGLGAVRLALAGAALSRATKGAARWRRVGRVQVLSHPSPGVAWAALLPSGPVVVLSAQALADPARRRLALRHELVHHRHGDPLWAWAWLLLRATLGWNPLLAPWARRAALAEELAVDAAVVSSPRVSPRAYGALLVHALVPPTPAPALGLSPRSLLHQRLSMLARPPAPRPLRAATLSLVGVLVLSLSAWAGRGLAADHRLATDAFQVLVERTGGAVPAAPVIHGQLVGVLGPGRAFYARGLARRPAWQPLVDDALAQAGLPPFLAAVPLVESGYTNWGAPDGDEEQSRAPGTIPGRGLWMFIAPTARQYGLRVDDTVDERLDPEKETAAAVALLSDMYDRYGDWGLALSAYNMGPRAVDAAIEAGGTRDPWELTARGLLNEYAAQVMAAALVLKAPELVE